VSHTGADAAAQDALAGEWVEYWSLVGAAESQRYVFTNRGEFVWAAAPSGSAPTAGTPLRRTGSYEVRQNGQARTLLLHVASTVLAGCDSACEAEAGTFVVEHKPALLEVLDYGECAQNSEAQTLDEHYACAALGEHAFWRRR
jgi:hypothetical protein